MSFPCARCESIHDGPECNAEPKNAQTETSGEIVHRSIFYVKVESVYAPDFSIFAASRATAANLLSALVAELTGTPNNGKISVPSASVTGRRGRPPKS